LKNIKLINDITKFYSSLDELSKKMKDVDMQVGDRNAKLTFLIEEFIGKIEKKKVSESIKNKTPLEQMIIAREEFIQNSLKNWREIILRRQNELKFRNKFNDSLLIIIYGKVKAGKSYLGNFLTKHKLPEQKAEFFKYDDAQNRSSIQKLEELTIKEFDVKRTECTHSIQGFRLSGLTFVDTPGLGSMTKENGDLARKYIQAADFIIFPIASDSPGRHSDNEEIKDIVHHGKYFTIVITKSDICEEDEVNGKIVKKRVNKSIKNRKAQEGYVLKESIPQNCNMLLGDVISISAMAANEGIEENDEEKFKNSNILDFYEILTKIIKNESVKLKIESPDKTLKAFVEDIKGGPGSNNEYSIHNIYNQMTGLENEINKTVKNFDKMAQKVVGLIESDIDPIIDEVINSDVIKDPGMLKKHIENEIDKVINKRIEEGLKEIIVDFDQKLTTDFCLKVDDDKITVKDKTHEITYTDEIAKSGKGESLGGTIGGIGAATVAGEWAAGSAWLAPALATNPFGWAALGVIGIACLAGAAGTFLGSAVGSGVGSAMAKTITEEIKIGTNASEIASLIKEQAQEDLVVYTKKTFEHLKKHYFEPIFAYTKNVKIEIELLDKKIAKEFK